MGSKAVGIQIEKYVQSVDDTIVSDGFVEGPREKGVGTRHDSTGLYRQEAALGLVESFTRPCPTQNVDRYAGSEISDDKAPERSVT